VPILPSDAPAPKVAVLLGLFNGAVYLQAQLDSIVAQSLPPTRIIISDDGSTDGCGAVVDEFAANWDGEVLRMDGPQEGFAANFLHLIRHCPDDHDMVALCDQDDVWLDGKLQQQWAALSGLDTPMLHGTRTLIVGADLARTRVSRRMTIDPSFTHALAQNMSGGNTLAFNRAGLALARRAAAKTRRIVAHDWWLYQLFTGAGAQVVHDPEPTLLYRQHGSNLMGENTSLAALRHRAAKLGAGQYRDWTDVNLAALDSVADMLTPQANETLAAFRAARAASLPGRVAKFALLGLRRQGVLGQLGLWAAMLSGEI